MTDWLAVIISIVYIAIILGVGEGLRQALHYSPDFTRKLVHIGIGCWSIGTVLLFQNPWIAIILPALFVPLNYLSYRYNLLPVMENDNKSNLGTVYFPLAFCVVILVLWPWPNRVVAALMPLTWGDAMAAVLGKRYGHIKYQVLGSTRSVEGSISMAIFSFISTLLALWLLPPSLSLFISLGVALAITLAATLTESISPWGIDNLTIPTVCVLILYFWQF